LGPGRTNDRVNLGSSSGLRARTTQRLQRGQPFMAGMLALVSLIVYCVSAHVALRPVRQNEASVGESYCKRPGIVKVCSSPQLCRSTLVKGRQIQKELCWKTISAQTPKNITSTSKKKSFKTHWTDLRTAAKFLSLRSFELASPACQADQKPSDRWKRGTVRRLRPIATSFQATSQSRTVRPTNDGIHYESSPHPHSLTLINKRMDGI
jgi:hypothetical protein